jgi:hypothetical protein
MKWNAEEILTYIISLLLMYLEDLSDIADTPDEQFAYGKKTAYTESLEILAYWDKAEVNGLDFQIEERFPL